MPVLDNALLCIVSRERYQTGAEKKCLIFGLSIEQTEVLTLLVLPQWGDAARRCVARLLRLEIGVYEDEVIRCFQRLTFGADDSLKYDDCDAH